MNKTLSGVCVTIIWSRVHCTTHCDVTRKIPIWRVIQKCHDMNIAMFVFQRSSLSPVRNYFTDIKSWGTHITLRWRHNGCDSVPNHQPRECLLRRLIRRTSKKTSKLRVTGLCAGNSPETGEFPAQMASNAENVSIWWRHHESSVHSSETQHQNNTLLSA